MSTSPAEKQPLATHISVSSESLTVALKDGRTLTAPLSWFPRLVNGSSVERNHWELIGSGLGIHWPDLDEDISIEGLLAGHPSGESRSSLEKWLRSRL